MNLFFANGIISICLLSESLHALPQNPQVVEGLIEFAENKNSLHISSSDKSIIHWDSFSIAKDEATHFLLPHHHAAILNRVVGSNPSEIYGHLHSNGQVYLINPHGILISKDGLIHVGGFFASTLDFSNQEFLSQKELHLQGDGKIENQGVIRADNGNVVLMAHQIQNQGEIFSSNEILLGVGQEMTYYPYGDEKIQIHLHPQIKTGHELIGIQQDGTLQAQQIELKADGNFYSYAIKNDGYIKAISTQNKDGHIYFVAEDGVACHSGSMVADEVRILGQHVRVIDEATIDVSETNLGGVILLGGDYQGSNPEILNANTTLVEKNAVLTANALESGDGGKIIVWADGVTGFYGTANVNAAPTSGNGGFVEVSGKCDLDFQGIVHAQALNGKRGMLLLDPSNTTISAAGADNGSVSFTAGPPCPSTYTTTGNSAVISASLLSSRLDTGSCDITISTSPGGTQAGTLSVTDTISWTSNNSLIITANSTTTITAAITNTSDSASIEINSGANLTVSAPITLTGATTSATGTLTLTASAIGSADMTINDVITATNKNLTLTVADTFSLSSTGSIIFSSPGKTFTYSTTAAGPATTFTGPVAINGNSTFTTTGGITFSGDLTTTGDGTMNMSADGSVAFNGTTSYGSTGMLTVISGNDITLGGDFTVPVSGGANVLMNPFDNFTLNTGDTLSYAGAPGNTFTILGGPTSAITFNGPVNVTGGNFTTSSQDITTIDEASAFTFNSPGGTATFVSRTNNLSVMGDLTITNGTLSMDAFNDIIFSDTSVFTYNTPESSTLTASGPDGDILLHGIMTATAGSLSMSATGPTSSIVSNTTSNLTWNSPGTWTWSATAITHNGILTVNAGNITMTATEDISFSTSNTVDWNSSGALSLITTANADSDVSINGSLDFTNGSWSIDAMGTITTVAGSIINYGAPGVLSMFSHQGAIDLSGNLTITTPALFSMTTLVGDVGIHSFVTNTSTGNITVTTAGDFSVGGVGESSPSQLGTAGGLLVIDARSLTVQATDPDPGSYALLGFTPGFPSGGIFINVEEGASILANTLVDASIQSPGELTLIAGGNFVMEGTTALTANGPLILRAENILLTRNGASLLRIETTLGDMLLEAMNSFTATDARISNLGSGDLTIVVDQQAPFPPEVGPGQFNLLGFSILTTTPSGELGIFTATPEQNRIEGLINGATLAQGNQVFGVWFSTFSGSSAPPFTIYYKFALPPTPPTDLTDFIRLGIASAQMTQQMLDRSMGLAWQTQFVVCDEITTRETWLFKRKPFEYPLFLDPIECSLPVLRATIDPYKSLFY